MEELVEKSCQSQAAFCKALLDNGPFGFGVVGRQGYDRSWVQGNVVVDVLLGDGKVFLRPLHGIAARRNPVFLVDEFPCDLGVRASMPVDDAIIPDGMEGHLLAVEQHLHLASRIGAMKRLLEVAD